MNTTDYSAYAGELIDPAQIEKEEKQAQADIARWHREDPRWMEKEYTHFPKSGFDAEIEERRYVVDFGEKPARRRHEMREEAWA